VPALPTEELVVALIGALGVGDCDFADQAAQQACVIRPRLQSCRNERIDRGIDPTDEETGNTGDSLQVTAVGRVSLQSRNVGLCHPLVQILGKQQRHVNANSLGDKLAESGMP
jgi:hypothetical protein